MLVRKFEMPWRRVFEGYGLVLWLVAALIVLAQLKRSETSVVQWSLFAGCIFMMLTRVMQALPILRLRAALSGQGMEFVSWDTYAKETQDPTKIYCGQGFEWMPVHSQRLYELAKIDYRQMILKPALLRALFRSGREQPDDEIGLPYIHGVEPSEVSLRRPLQNFEGGTLVVGTTQAGKGVVLSGLMVQAVRRGDVVVIIDPKNSERMKRIVQRACEVYREPTTFLEFHPAFPEIGCRLDPMFNWQKPTELASRIQAILPHDTAGAFTAFGWEAVNTICQGAVELEDRPNLVKITRNIEAGIDSLLERSLMRFFPTVLGDKWRDTPELKALLTEARKPDPRKGQDRALAELHALADYYKRHISSTQQTKVIDSLVRTFLHNREHYQKITANLLPTLQMLTSGMLGKSLSPDPFDASDTRPIMNLEKVVTGGHVLYICLDSLPDPGVASAIAGIVLADLAALAGIRYNLGGSGRIALFCDELANVVNRPLIEILNKGAEGGIYSTCAMQTLGDLADRLGSEEAARMALGNLNNMFALRSKDLPTQQYIVETFGKTGIHSAKTGLNHGMDSHIGDFSAGHSTMMSETLEEMIQPAVLGKLPNLQYFASVSGGRLLKGRAQIINVSTTGK